MEKNRLTGNQAHVLYQIVKYARGNGWRVPTDKQLGEILGISAKMANDYRSKIQRKLKCFQPDGRQWKVDDDRVCTQPESALYLLFFHEVSQGRRVLQTTFLNLLRDTFQGLLPGDEGLSHIFKSAVDSNYLRVVGANPAYLEAGPRLSMELEYLDLSLSLFVRDKFPSRVDTSSKVALFEPPRPAPDDQ